MAGAVDRLLHVACRRRPAGVTHTGVLRGVLRGALSHSSRGSTEGSTRRCRALPSSPSRWRVSLPNVSMSCLCSSLQNNKWTSWGGLGANLRNNLGGLQGEKRRAMDDSYTATTVRTSYDDDGGVPQRRAWRVAGGDAETALLRRCRPAPAWDNRGELAALVLLYLALVLPSVRASPADSAARLIGTRTTTGPRRGGARRLSALVGACRGCAGRPGSMKTKRVRTRTRGGGWA